MRSSGTSRTLTVRPDCARNGNRMLVKSPAAVSTSPPAGRLAAISPANTDTWLPTATAEGGTPTSRAQQRRASASGPS